MRTMVCLLVVSGALLCSAVTITYRDGHAMVCDVLSKDDTNLIVRTIKGVQTNTWRELTTASFKAVHPELFARLTQQMLERKKQYNDEMKAKGLIQVGGKWVDKKDYELKALARVKLNVVTTESVGKYSEVERIEGGSKSKRTKCGVLKIKLDSLDNTRSYTVRVQYTLYISQAETKDVQEVDKDAVKQETIRKEYAHAMKIRTTPVDEYKEVLRGVRGISATERKIGVQGWDVKIWLNKTLVYEQTRDSKPVYHSVTKW